MRWFWVTGGILLGLLPVVAWPLPSDAVIFPGSLVFGQFSAYNGGVALDTDTAGTDVMHFQIPADQAFSLNPSLAVVPAPLHSQFTDPFLGSVATDAAYSGFVGAGPRNFTLGGAIRVQTSATHTDSGPISGGPNGAGRAAGDIAWFDTVRLVGTPDITLSYLLEPHVDAAQFLTGGSNSFARAEVSIGAAPTNGSPFSGVDALEVIKSSGGGDVPGVSFPNGQASCTDALSRGIGGLAHPNAACSNLLGHSGDTYEVGIEVNTLLNAGGGGASVARIDMGATAFFTLDPITPGATYETGSGNDYLTADFLANESVVPEPSTIALLGAGFVGLGLRRFRPRS